MTERDTAGADPTQLATTAVRDGEDWVVNGRKWFISNAQIADFFIVTAVTDPHAPRHSKTSQLIIPAGTPGVAILRPLGSMEEPRPRDGEYPSHAEMTFTDARVPAGALLGEQGAGFTVAQLRLGPGRIHHCMRWLGQARRAFDMMCERSTYRSVQGSLLGEKGTVRGWIAESAAQMQAARLMTLHAAWIADTQGFAAARKEIAYIKFFGAAVLHDVLDRAVQIHGSLGYSTDLPLESMYRAARASRLYDGPDEVHRDSAARLILRDYAPPAGGVPSEHRPTRRQAARAQFAWLLDEGSAGA